MNRKELVAATKEEFSLRQVDAENMVGFVFDKISDELAEGNDVQILGFGKFEVKHRAAREGTNPRTKEKIVIPASSLPTFKPSKMLKERVNK